MWVKFRNAAWETIKFFAITLAIVLPIRTFVAQPFIVSGASMSPTFTDNQYLVIDELSYRFNDPAHGEVIVFKYPKDETKHFIKRIIGLPGETITIHGSDVKINDRKVDESAYVHEPFQADLEMKLLPDQYFVMGDNRAVSLDSRAWGPLPRQLITGRVLVRLLPPNAFAFSPGQTTAVGK